MISGSRLPETRCAYTALTRARIMAVFAQITRTGRIRRCHRS